MKKLATIAILVLLALPFTAFGQSSTQFWRLVGNKLRPIVNSYRVDSPAGFSGNSLTVSGLKSCAGIQTNANGVTSCGSGGTGGAWSNTGSLQTYFDPRYVNVAGDTMTGALNIVVTGGTRDTVAVEAPHAISGSTLFSYIDNVVSTIGTALSSAFLGYTGTGSSLVNGTTSEKTIIHPNGIAHVLEYSGAYVMSEIFTETADIYGQDDNGTDSFAINSYDIATQRGANGAMYFSPDSISINDTATGLEWLGLGPSSSWLKSNLTVGRISTPKATLDVPGIASGTTIYATKSFSGAGLSDCDTAGTSKLLWDSTTGRFSCGTDTDTNTTYTAGKGLTLTSTAFSTNDTLTGTMLRFLTVSGSLVYGKTTLASSGTLVVEGAMSGASLFVGTSIKGSGLVDCQNATTSKLLWNATTGRFSCGTDTDTNTTYTAGQGLTLTSTSFRLNASHSGTVIWAGTTLRSSGGLVVESTTSGATAYFGSLFIGKPALSTNTKLDVLGTISGSLIAQNGAGNNFFAGNVGIGKTPTTKLEVVGTISGSTVRATTLSGNVIRGGQFSQRQLSMEIFASGSTITTGSGKAFMTVPWSMSGYNLSRAWVSVGTGGYTGSTSVQVRNAEKGFRKLFSTPLTLDDRRFGSGQVVIDSNTREVGALDRLFFDIPTVTTTAPKSPMVILLDFYKP